MSLYAVGVDLGTMQAAGAAPTLIRGSKTFTGAANLGAVGAAPVFTTTGAVALDGFWVRCTTTLSDTVDGAEFTIGTTNDPAILYDGTTATGAGLDLDTLVAGLWVEDPLGDYGSNLAGGISRAPAAVDENILMTVSGQAITGGVLVFYALYRPLSAGASLALGTGMVAV